MEFLSGLSHSEWLAQAWHMPVLLLHFHWFSSGTFGQGSTHWTLVNSIGTAELHSYITILLHKTSISYIIQACHSMWRRHCPRLWRVTHLSYFFSQLFVIPCSFFPLYKLWWLFCNFTSQRRSAWLRVYFWIKRFAPHHSAWCFILIYTYSCPFCWLNSINRMLVLSS